MELTLEGWIQFIQKSPMLSGKLSQYFIMALTYIPVRVERSVRRTNSLFFVIEIRSSQQESQQMREEQNCQQRIFCNETFVNVTSAPHSDVHLNGLWISRGCLSLTHDVLAILHWCSDDGISAKISDTFIGAIKKECHIVFPCRWNEDIESKSLLKSLLRFETLSNMRQERVIRLMSNKKSEINSAKVPFELNTHRG